jgi:hypothetical protein
VSVLQIDIQGTDADGNIATSTIEVEVVDPAPAAPAAPAAPGGGTSVVPPAFQTGATMAPGTVTSAEPASPEAHHGVPGHAAGETSAMHRQFGDKPVTISGFTNGVQAGHQGAQPAAPAPKVSQVVRSKVLWKNTGGFR